MRVLISGASGLVGTELQAQLKELGHTPVVLVRREVQNENEVFWDPTTLTLDPKVMDSIDAIVNLAGATTGKLPWTKEYKKELIGSRVDSTKTIVQAMQKCSNKPKVLISGSASGIYGDTGDTLLIETAPKGEGFLADLASQWEREALKSPSGVRVIQVRTTMVLSRT